MNKKVTNCIVAAISVIFLVFLDQITKILAVLHLSPQHGGTDIILWQGVFRLRYLENRGAAFGILQGQKLILVLITAMVFIGLCWFYYRIPCEKHFRIMQGISVFIMAGAIGNFIDRIRCSYVIDFFYFELINFPIFNVADIYVTCAVFLFIIVFLFYYKEEDIDRILPSKKKESK